MSFQPLCQSTLSLSLPLVSRRVRERVAERVISTIFHQRRRGNENTTIIEIIRHRTVKQDTRLLTPIIYRASARRIFFTEKCGAGYCSRLYLISYNLRELIEVGFFKGRFKLKNYLILLKTHIINYARIDNKISYFFNKLYLIFENFRELQETQGSRDKLSSVLSLFGFPFSRQKIPYSESWLTAVSGGLSVSKMFPLSSLYDRRTDCVVPLDRAGALRTSLDRSAG